MVTAYQVKDKLTEIGVRTNVQETIEEITGLTFRELASIVDKFATSDETASYLVYGMMVGMQLAYQDGTSVPTDAIRVDHSW